MLELRGVTKVYRTGGVTKKALDNVSVNFRANEFAAILGPSGSGKTTLLNIIGGLDKYDSGDLTINEKSTKKFRDKDWDSYRNHRVGFVFQSYNLIPHQTVLENVRLALVLSGISKKESIERAKKVLNEVGLKEHINKRPSQLSGGQMQRVAIARAIVNDPDILLADEPTGALDSNTSIQIMDLLAKIAKNKLVIMVTHNPELADEYATRIIKLKDGKIISDSDKYDGKVKTDLALADSENKSKKTKMSFITALKLSLKNLLTKKARTILVAIAGSIGIIGIALISAVSTGFQNYIDSIENDTLTSYPLTLQKESSDLTGALLSITEGNSGEPDGKVHEKQIVTSMLGNISTNDLKSFREYLDHNYDEVGDDLRLIENEYSVDPPIYTIDATGELAKLNPNNLFTSVMGDSSLLSSYSSITSIYMQYDPENLQNDMEVVAGRYPENYNEMVVYLSDPSQISDLLTYSLGFHDASELTDTVTKILSGEKVELNNEPLELTYDDLMGVDLRMIPSTSTYRYNASYDIYEDMSGNADFMKNLYENGSEQLKIVGIVTPKNSTLSAGSGVIYLPSLITHIIEESAKTEVTQKQLQNPGINVFSNTAFGEENNDFNFEFSDLVSVDNAALEKAFNITIDENAIKTKTNEYMTQISDDITADTTPVKNALINRYKNMSNEFLNELVAMGEISYSNADVLVADFINRQDFSDLEVSYLVPKDNFKTMNQGIMKSTFDAFLQFYITSFSVDPNTIDTTSPGFATAYTSFTETSLSTMELDAVFEQIAIPITETGMQKSILSAVGNLTTYLSQTFAGAFNADQEALASAFHLKFTEDELARVVTAMFTEEESTLSTNLSALGYQDLSKPTFMSFYFTSFDGKTHFMKFLDNYNDLMYSYGSDDKIIEYTDTTGLLLSSVKTIVDAVSYVLIAFVSISLIVSSIMIGVITYISVYERKKEIGILRAMGASKHNISSIFNAETFIIGLLSGLFGVGFSYLTIPIINAILHNFIGDIPLYASLSSNTAAVLTVLSVILTIIGGLIPAKSASKKDPVEALRSE
jgi:putative ABC transport system permease protein